MKIDIWQSEREKAQVLPCGLKIIIALTGKGFPSLKIWRPKAIKPYQNYYYKTQEQLEKSLAEEIRQFELYKKMINDRKIERLGTSEDLKKIRVGDIYHGSWGYDQTQCEYWQIVEVHGKVAIFREVMQKAIKGSESFMSENRKPLKDHFTSAKPIRRIVGFSQGVPYFNGDNECYCLSPWEGKENYCSWYA